MHFAGTTAGGGPVLPAGGLCEVTAVPGVDCTRQRPDLRMVAFEEGAGCMMADEDRQRLRAANIQDSVVIIRTKLGTGNPLGPKQSEGSVSSSSRSSESGEEDGAAVFPAAKNGMLETGHIDTLTAAPEISSGQHLEPLQPHSVLHHGQLQHSSSKRVQFQGQTGSTSGDPA